MALLEGPPRGPQLTATEIDAAGGPRIMLESRQGLFADQAHRQAQQLLDGWNGDGITALSYRDARYPQNLCRWDQRPALLFVRGELEKADLDAVAIIGTRHPTTEGARLSSELARTLVEAGQPVISGLAAGIDTAAHLGALLANGRTLAVLGNGIRHIYPAANASLQRQIPVLISQFLPNQPPTRETFPARNALMAAISRATVIVEAGERSGARIQARHARDMGRPLVLMSSVLRQDWARALTAHEGVHVIDTAEDLFGVLG